jgi:hypothetical protein
MAGQRVGMNGLSMKREYIWHFQSGVECHTASESSQHFQDRILALAKGREGQSNER